MINVGRSVGLWMLLAVPAYACPVCFNPTDLNRQAFVDTTIFLSLFPLGMMGGIGWWLYKRGLS